MRRTLSPFSSWSLWFWLLVWVSKLEYIPDIGKVHATLTYSKSKPGVVFSHGDSSSEWPSFAKRLVGATRNWILFFTIELLIGKVLSWGSNCENSFIIRWLVANLIKCSHWLNFYRSVACSKLKLFVLFLVSVMQTIRSANNSFWELLDNERCHTNSTPLNLELHSQCHKLFQSEKWWRLIQFCWDYDFIFLFHCNKSRHLN